VLLDDDNNVIGTTGVVADITDRKQQEFERDRCRRLLDSILQDDRLLNPEVPGDEIPRLAAAMATELLECAFATYWTQDGPALVAGEGGPTTAGTKLSLDEHPEMQQTLQRKQIYRPTKADELSDDRIFVPVTVGGELVGVLDLQCEESELQRDETLRMVAARLSDQLGGALALYQHRQIQLRVHELSERLQQGLVPTLQVRTDAVQAASWYRPGEHRMIVGGDFVDVMVRDDRSLAFVIGDVSGHGPEAAALGATMRGAWAGLAVSGADPRDWVSGLHALVAKVAAPGTFVTALVGVVSASGDRIQLTNAGHPAPLFFDDNGTHTPDGGGTALGLVDEPADPFDLEISPTGNWRLLLYTDGLIEGRCNPDSADRLGAEALAAHALQETALRIPLHPWLDDLANLAVTRNGGPLPDDVAMLGLGSPDV
jgi:serine phosphatase RsbU (regulator of sigma subunit)